MKEDARLERFKALFPEDQWTNITKRAIERLLAVGVEEGALYRALCLIRAARRSNPGKVGDPLPVSWNELKNLPQILRRLSERIKSIDEHWPFASDKWLSHYIKEEHAEKGSTLAMLCRGLPNTLVYYAWYLEQHIRDIGRSRMATSKTNIPLNDAVKALLWKVRHDTNGRPCLNQIAAVLSALSNSEKPVFDERALSRLAKSSHQPRGHIFRDICGPTNGR